MWDRYGREERQKLTTCIPSAMDALRGILEVELYALVHKAGIARHDDRPAGVAGGHGRHVEALLPLLVDPLEGERVRHLKLRKSCQFCPERCANQTATHASDKASSYSTLTTLWQRPTDT